MNHLQSREGICRKKVRRREERMRTTREKGKGWRRSGEGEGCGTMVCRLSASGGPKGGSEGGGGSRGGGGGRELVVVV
ncbi:hypothetical protein L6452_14701 [Arctium lappa]|uniref:Uncharacterized protein n=1 Tax=Arctium lappa TaxID=4217 RepID=A0ACB9CLR4_ARCLA|nr:hypothetical protein L6452_14701 [Arctium lappa]